jgi:Fe-S oxidoreductase
MNPNFNPFILPFLIGASIMGVVLISKFVIWLKNLNKKQRGQLLRNIMSFKTLKAIWEIIRESLLHVNIFKTNFALGYMHFCFAFGWLMLIIMGKMEEIFSSGKIFTEPWLGIFFKYFEPAGDNNYPLQGYFLFVMDLLLLFVLSGLLLALVKRTYSRTMGMKKTTNHSIIDRIALTALWFIFPCRLLAESATVSIKGNGSFLTGMVGNWLSGLPVEQMELPMWWIYSSALCVFFVLMPFTRYMHIFTEVLLIFLRKWGVVEAPEHTGYTNIELNACSRCGICLDVCPLNSAAGINDIQAVYFIRATRRRTLKEEIADNCLLCNRCSKACPVGIEQSAIREIHRKKEGFKKDNYYEYLKITPKKDDLKKVIYFAGCMSHLTPGIIIAMRQIFDRAGVQYIFLDKEKNICCGRPLKQQGFLEQAKSVIRKNTNLINSMGADFLVTSCPICYNSFSKEHNLSIPVMHHTQYIEQLLCDGRITIEKDTTQRIVYHDPCEISRGHDIYEAPRNILTQAGLLIPAAQERDDSFCCGGSLGNTVLSPEQITVIRDQALDSLCTNQPDIIVTSCPLCKKSFQRGGKSSVEVKDVAEVVSQQLTVMS